MCTEAPGTVQRTRCQQETREARTQAVMDSNLQIQAIENTRGKNYHAEIFFPVAMP